MTQRKGGKPWLRKVPLVQFERLLRYALAWRPGAGSTRPPMSRVGACRKCRKISKTSWRTFCDETRPSGPNLIEVASAKTLLEQNYAHAPLGRCLGCPKTRPHARPRDRYLGRPLGTSVVLKMDGGTDGQDNELVLFEKVMAIPVLSYQVTAAEVVHRRHDALEMAPPDHGREI